MTSAEYDQVRTRLLAFYTPAEIAIWTHSPHPQLNGRTAMNSALNEVMAIIDRLESSAYI